MKKLYLLVLLTLAIPAFAAHSVQLSWTDSDTGVTFNVYRATAACSTNPSFTLHTSGGTPLTYTDSTVGVGKFCYYVTGVDTASGLESLPSNSADAKVLPKAPVLGNPVVSKLNANGMIDVEVSANPDSDGGPIVLCRPGHPCDPDDSLRAAGN